MLAYIWNEKGKYPHEILALPLFEKLFVYEATQLRIDAEADAAKPKGKGKGRKGGKK